VRKAVVDIGSNSVLLVVAERSGRAWKTVFESSRVTGLGRDASLTGHLNEDAMRATLRAVHDCFEEARELGATSVRAAATMAARLAANAGEFLERARAQGTPVQVLSAEREAALGFASAAEDPLFSRNEALTVVDVGGHSTEIVCASKVEGRWNRLFTESFAVGTLKLISGPLRDELPDGPMRLEAATLVDRELSRRSPPKGISPVVSLGATGTNLVSIRERLAEWDPESVHGSRLSYEEISRAFSSLCELSASQRRALPGIERDREDTLHAGALILERCLFSLAADDCLVSARGWRHALLAEE
jgi:exopolyphosphatase/guanosine-5'-triphosphate,3'-diphosphate pyrophosphatase